MSATAAVSVIVPARNEAAALPATLARLREPEVLEVIVVDGRSTDATCAVAAAAGAHVLECEPGRARQLNAGARTARGAVLLFLHADTEVPPGFGAAIVAAVAGGAAGGRFDLELDADGVAFRVIERMIGLRSRWSGLHTGDQATFVRRDVFERIGGYPELPLFEDLELSRRLRRAGRVACLRERVRTSARRWRRDGVVRTIVLMWTLRSLWALGVPAEWLARWYRDVR